MVSHERIRGSDGQIQKVISHLYHVFVPWPIEPRDQQYRRVEAALDFNPNKTLQSERSSLDFCPDSRVSYLRTPLFVPNKFGNESEGRLFCWSYDSVDETMLSAYLLIFDGKLDSLVRVDMRQQNVPYSVHSSVYSKQEALLNVQEAAFKSGVEIGSKKKAKPARTAQKKSRSNK